MGIGAESVPRVWRERKYKYRLIGGRCESCSHVFYPYRTYCPLCGGNVREERLPRTGRIIAYTVIRFPPRDFSLQQPYVVALVELDNGAKTLAQLTDVDPEKVSIGLRVEAVFRKYREQGDEGIIEYGIKFRPL